MQALATAISGGGSHCLALRNDGTVWAWGDNSLGQLGDNSTTQRGAPVQTSVLAGVSAVFARSDHSMALKSDGTVWAWGENSSGQLGNGSTAGSRVPLQIPGLSGIAAISGGSQHGLALNAAGAILWAWGDNSSGQIGDGTTNSRLSPKMVPLTLPGGVTITAISASGSSTLILLSDKTVMTWGDNTFGQLGTGTFGFNPVPATVP